MKLRDLYYRLKYRNLKGSAAAVGVIIGGKKKKDDFDKKLDEIARRTTPCYKTNDEVLAYIREKYNLTPVEFSKADVENYKVNYIMNNCPEVLTTPEYSLPDNRKSPTKKQMQAYNESSDKRFKEAWNYPIERLGIEFDKYIIKHKLSDGYEAEFTLVVERTKDQIFMSGGIIGHTVSEDENKLIRGIFADINIYKGVTQEDIDNRTKRFIGYSAAVMDFEKINRADSE